MTIIDNSQITRDVIRQFLPAIATEMALDLQRSSYNMMIYEVKDSCCALVDPSGALMCQNIGGVSHFVSDLGVIITDAVERIGLDGFRPGDGYLMNHQRVTGQHLNNMVAYRPVFVDGKVVCFSMVRAHWIDVGGMSTGFGAGPMMADPWQEGLQLDQIRLYEGDEVDQKVLKIISDNIRYPDSSLGDMRAQFAACRLGEERVVELIGRYGLSTFYQAVEALYADSEARCRLVVDQIPDGEYYAESSLDHDAVERDRPVEIKVRVVVSGSDMTIDLTGCSEQRRGGINARSLAAPYIAYKSLTTPNEPVNEGSFRALKVEIQEGNFMMARFPAPMSNWSLAIPRIVETIWLALAPAIPERIAACN
jgi:N-methylhydantoinase B